MTPSSPYGDTTPVAELRTGQRINARFRIEAFLGRGGMSVVYRAWDEVKDSPVALKFLHPSLLNDPEVARAFEREAQVSMRLNHPFLLKVFDQRAHADRHFLVMELLTGGTLREWMRTEADGNGRTPYHDTCRILSSICQGLQNAHESTIHRDLKPENIGLTKDGMVKIMDFGLAQLTEARDTAPLREAVTQLHAGTPYYLAPERLGREPHSSPASDQYSVGVMAYEMFTGVLPTGLAQPLGQQCPHLPPRLAQAIDRSLSLQPTERFPSIGDLGDVFEQSQHESPSAWHRYRRQTLGHPAFWGFTAFVALTLFSFFPLSQWHAKQRSLQERTQAAWQSLSALTSELDEVALALKEKRQSLEFLEAQAALKARLVEGASEGIGNSSPAPERSLAAVRELWQTVAPRLTDRGTFRSIDLRLAQAKQAISTGQLDQFDAFARELRTEKPLLLRRLDDAQKALLARQELLQQIENLTTLDLTQSLFAENQISQAVTLAEDHVENERWDQALPVLDLLTEEFRTQLDITFNAASRGYQEALSHWVDLFPATLGPPDLWFLYDLKPILPRSSELHRRGDTAQACQLFKEATQHLNHWTGEVRAFRARMDQVEVPTSDVIDAQGMPFVRVHNLYWSRCEIRVMDLARYLADDNPLSGDTGDLWQRPGFKIGPTHPVIGITRRDAKAFSNWIGNQLLEHGRPAGRLPTREEWQSLIAYQKVHSSRFFGIHPNPGEWQKRHFETHYADPRVRVADHLGPVTSGSPSPGGFFGLTSGVWEWTGSTYEYEAQRPIDNEAQKWLLAGGGTFGTVGYNAFPPPEPHIALVLRRESIGLRPVLDPLWK